jgi:streptogramin lyase
VTAPAGAVSVTEFPLRAGSVPLAITAGPDGNMWFTELSGSRIGRIKPSGRIDDWSTGSGISANSRPWGIVAGPDGNLWFTEEAKSQVGRMSPTSLTATEFSAGAGISANSGPRGIAVGPDRAIWFAEDAGRIGRIVFVPGGGLAFTEFSNGITAGSRPLGIAAGPDGNVWFTEQADRIGRITPTGMITETGIGISPNSLPSEITAGPDGNLWFTEETGNRIARITTSGNVTEFPLAPLSQPRGIVAGPDGNLWFAEEAGNRIGRITPAGKVTEFSTGITRNSEPTYLAFGPDGNLWFSESYYQLNAIGRLILDPAATTGGAASITAGRADLAGSVTPFGAQTSYVFEYGRRTTYGSATGSRILQPGTKPEGVAARVLGLRPHTRYHYRLVASSAGGTTYGSDRTFTTTGGRGGGASPPRNRTAPKMAIVSRLLRFTPGGLVRVSLHCPLAETMGCHGTIAIDTANKVTVTRAGSKLRRRVRLGSVHFRVGGGQTRTVTIRLSTGAQALARRLNHLRVIVTVTAFDAFGNRAATVKLLGLRPQVR